MEEEKIIKTDWAVSIKRGEKEITYKLPSAEEWKKTFGGKIIKHYDEDIYSFELEREKKPIHIGVHAKIDEITMFDEELKEGIDGKGTVGRKLAEILKCKVLFPDTIVCTADVDSIKGFIDRDKTYIMLEKKE